MWDLIRWAAALTAFTLRWARWLFVSPPVNRIDDVEFLEEPTRYGVRVRVPIIFDVRPTRDPGRLQTRTPQRTGDPTFDDRALVRSESPALITALAADDHLRRTILQLLTDGSQGISGDGRSLWVEGQATPDSVHRLSELRVLLEANTFQRVKAVPRFDLRIALIESVIWALATYGLVAFAESLFGMDGQVHVSQELVFFCGLGVAVALGGLLMLMTFVLLRRSPMERKPITAIGARAFCMLLGWAGVQLVSDLNRHLDSSTSVTIHRTIANRTMRSGKYGDRYHLGLSSEHDSSPVRIGSSLTVSWVDYLKSARSKDITLHVKRGWLGLPWFEGIEVGHQACPVYRISRVIGFGNPRLNSFHRPTIGQEPPSTNYTNYLTRGTLLVRDTKRVTWTMTIARNWLIHSAV